MIFSRQNEFRALTYVVYLLFDSKSPHKYEVEPFLAEKPESRAESNRKDSAFVEILKWLGSEKHAVPIGLFGDNISLHFKGCVFTCFSKSEEWGTILIYFQ